MKRTAISERRLIARARSMPPPANKRRRWRILYSTGTTVDWPSQTAAYKIIREELACGSEPIAVYEWLGSAWTLFEMITPAGDPQ